MKFLPSLPAIIKGMVITVITLVIVRFLPANIKQMILG